VGSFPLGSSTEPKRIIGHCGKRSFFSYFLDYTILFSVGCSALILIQALLLYSQRSEVAPAHSCWQGGKEDH
jgi:hypothetical protein